MLCYAKSLQSCPTLRDSMDGCPPGSPVPGILQARTLEWVAISLSDAWKWKVKVKSLSHVRLLATPWTAAYHAPPSRGFSRQEYWSGVPLPSPEGHKWRDIILWGRLQWPQSMFSHFQPSDPGALLSIKWPWSFLSCDPLGCFCLSGSLNKEDKKEITVLTKVKL